jgi:hypothetical protein
MTICARDEMTHAASGPWEIIAYEVRMFHATYEIVLSSAALAQLPRVLANAVEESAVLHTRILCEIFLPKAKSRCDDIQLSRLFPDWDKDTKYDRIKGIIEDLEGRYGTGKKRGHCWNFNKMMAHSTIHRGNHYDYTPALRDLRPVIQKIIDEIGCLRGTPFTWIW